MGLPADAVRRLGALGVLVEEDAERLAERLRLANAEADRLKALDDWWRVSPATAIRRRARCSIISGRSPLSIAC